MKIMQSTFRYQIEKLMLKIKEIFYVKYNYSYIPIGRKCV